MKSYGKHALWALLCLFLPVTAQAVKLQVTSPSGTVSVYQTDELLSYPQAREIEVANDGGYGQDMIYRAVRLAAVIGDASSVDDQTGLEVIALDGNGGSLSV